MKIPSMVFAGLMAGIGFTSLFAATEGLAQAQTIPDSLCNAYRERLAEHAQLSDGVRRDLASRIRTLPAMPPPMVAPPALPPAARAEAIRARLQRIPEERQRAEDGRLAAYVRLDFGRAAEFEQHTQALDAEKAGLERELAALQGGASRPPAAPPRPAPAMLADANRIPCQDTSAALVAAVKIRQRELGAKESQPGVVPLVVIKGQTADQIALDLARQFAAWPGAASQVGLLDQDGNARVEALVDAPAANLFRLYWQAADGSVRIDVVSLPGRSGDPVYSEVARRVEEATIRQTGRKIADLLTMHQSGPPTILGETGEFARAQALTLAGNYVEAARVEGGGARMTEFQNLRGESVRVIDAITPTPNGLLIRRVVATPGPQGEQLWEESTTLIRSTSQSRIEVEIKSSKERRNMRGFGLGPKMTAPPVAFGLDR